MKYTAEHYKYQLMEVFRVKTSLYPNQDIRDKFTVLHPDGWLNIQSGYAWDGASGPTFDTKSSMRAGLVHDALYQLMREGKLDQRFRKAVDREF